MMFKYEYLGTVYEIEDHEVFDPQKNLLLMMPKETIKDVLLFLKEVYYYNKLEIVKAKFPVETPVVSKFLEMFYRLVPPEDHHVLSTLSIRLEPYKIYFEFSPVYSEFTFVVSDTDAEFQGFVNLINKIKKSRKEASTLYVYSTDQSYFDHLSTVFAGTSSYSLRSYSLRLKEIVEYINQGGRPEVTAVLSGNVLTKLEIKMPVTYETRSSLYKTFQYSDKVPTVLGVSVENFRDKTDGLDTLYGIELEMSTNYTQREIIDSFPEIYGILKTDGSVSGNKSFPYELATLPRTMRRHKKNLSGFFKSLSTDHFDTRDSHTNGMHVHIDRLAFDPDTMHLKKFCWFFSNVSNRSFLTEISERQKKDILAWCNFVDTPPVSKTRWGKDAVNFVKADRHTQSSGRKSAVNLSNSATVEVRLFKGVISFASVLKNLEFCDAVLEFSRRYSFTDMTADAFLLWLNKLPPSSYRTLRLCLENMDLEVVSFESRIKEVLQSGPANIVVDILNKMYRSFNRDEASAVVGMFRLHFHAEGTTIRNDTDTDHFVLVRARTKFSKLNDKTLSLYNFQPKK